MMATETELDTEQMSNSTAHLQAAISTVHDCSLMLRTNVSPGAVGHYLMYYLNKNIDHEETCEYLLQRLDLDMGGLCDALITGTYEPSHSR